MGSLNSNGVFWGKEPEEKVKSKDEELELISERLEQHLESWVNHLDKSLIPELKDLNSGIKTEFNKIKVLTEFYKDINAQQREYLDEISTVITQQSKLRNVMISFQEWYNSFQKKTNFELQFNYEKRMLTFIT